MFRLSVQRKSIFFTAWLICLYFRSANRLLWFHLSNQHPHCGLSIICLLFTSYRSWDILLSALSTSFENLLRMRPDGVVSKKDSGDLRTAWSRFVWSFPDAWMHPKYRKPAINPVPTTAMRRILQLIKSHITLIYGIIAHVYFKLIV